MSLSLATAPLLRAGDPDDPPAPTPTSTDPPAPPPDPGQDGTGIEVAPPPEPDATAGILHRLRSKLGLLPDAKSQALEKQLAAARSDLAAVPALRKELAEAQATLKAYEAEFQSLEKAIDALNSRGESPPGRLADNFKGTVANAVGQHLRELGLPAAKAPAPTADPADGTTFEEKYEASLARGGAEHTDFCRKHRAEIEELGRRLRAGQN